MNDIHPLTTYPFRAVPVTVYKSIEVISNMEKDKIRNNKDWNQYRSDTGCVDISKSYRFLEENGMDQLLSTINKCVEKYCQEILCINVRLKPTGSWVTKQLKGGTHHAHNHPNTLLSAITYFNDCDDEISDLVFKNNALDDVFSNFKGFDLSSKITSWNIFNNFTYTLRPEVDQIIIFPGHLEHYTEISKSNYARYCIGVNYFLDDTIGDYNSKSTITISC